MPVAKSNEQQVKIVLKADAKAFTAGMQAASKAASRECFTVGDEESR